jgi:hypothetical protein
VDAEHALVYHDALAVARAVTMRLMRSAALLFLIACRSPSAPERCPRVVRGACVDDAAVARYCGRAAHWDGACVDDACPAGQVRDDVTAECLGTRALRAIGERQQTGDVPSCREGLVLRIAAGRARCDAQRAPIPRDRCPAGQALEPTSGACVVLRVADSVDATAWARAVLGADGTEGSPWLCGRLAADPGAYGLVSGATTTVELEVDLLMPNNDVSLARARTKASEMSVGGVSRPLPNAAEVLVDRAVEAETELFRALGGTANTAALTVRVRCSLHAGMAPQGGGAPTL